MCLAALAAPASLNSQTDTTRVLITGTVIDPLSHPVEGAEVRIVGAKLSVLTSAEGTFRLSVPRVREILVQVRRPGYSAQLLKLDGEWNGTILLQPGTFELPEIQVTARYAKPARYAGTNKYDDYFRRRRMGLGDFISREEIERRMPLHTVEIFDSWPGIKVVTGPLDRGTIVTFARCNENPPRINVYVDGHKLMPEFPQGVNAVGSESVLSLMSRGGTLKPEEIEARIRMRAAVGELLGRLNPNDIELIEIFRGPGELPPEFNDGNCGAISIWTRSGAR